jgi:peptidoglycan hydrolase FlgJ
MTVTLPAIAGLPPGAASDRADVSARDAVLRARAEELETAFLAEMLGHAGLGVAPEGFGGGIGEDQFASFLRREQAEAMTRAGGIGLAESIFRALMVRDDA